jgi:hypothetical protein
VKNKIRRQFQVNNVKCVDLDMTEPGSTVLSAGTFYAQLSDMLVLFVFCCIHKEEMTPFDSSISEALFFNDCVKVFLCKQHHAFFETFRQVLMSQLPVLSCPVNTIGDRSVSLYVAVAGCVCMWVWVWLQTQKLDSNYLVRNAVS